EPRAHRDRELLDPDRRATRERPVGTPLDDLPRRARRARPGRAARAHVVARGFPGRGRARDRAAARVPRRSLSGAAASRAPLPRRGGRVVSRRVAALTLLALAWQAAAAQGAPFIVGVGRSVADPPAVMDAIRALGVHSLRVDARWASIETSPGRYSIPAWLDAAVDAARAADVEPLLILAYGNPLYGGDKPRTQAARAAFARYAAYVARHFN